ncbi:LysE family translocator [Bradyrhizobium sp. BR 10289]|uniref:LysE family translocator n=1 Tax=Bradyrhizobium sp. BR 10289 TaxID=2749993 RepID=UPI001C650572|nr:LysE family translocator [Bradyrhizobium sp. BR 10289]MBW7972772.1 LysE family translocator [Bradyrhizobium sp. BR 10289]
MLDLHALLLFSLACLALTATPGPDMLLIASRSVAQGRSAGFATLAGIQAGTYCHALAAAFGLSELFLLVPLAYDAVRYAGAAYLLFLASQALRSNQLLALPAGENRRRSTLVVFRQGLLTNLLNPKMALFVLALFPQFVRTEAGSVALQVMILATVLNAIGLIVNGVVIVLASRVGTRFFGNSKLGRWPQYLLATVFGSLALKLAFDGKR